MTQAVTKPGRCQVRIYAESPCPRRAEVEILSVAFCGPCARKQEAYFAIGELTHEEARDLHSKPLAEVLERKRRERAESTDGIAAEMHHGLAGIHESKPLALRKS
ncbi:MAG: hypothetical protein M3Y38_04300 [Actinomycetota bacterium]|nr:hypothetical protein [Actinomycetota bacterium]